MMRGGPRPPCYYMRSKHSIELKRYTRVNMEGLSKARHQTHLPRTQELGEGEVMGSDNKPPFIFTNDGAMLEKDACSASGIVVENEEEAKEVAYLNEQHGTR